MVVSVGESLPPFRRQTTLENWNRFAAVNDEFIPIHMDDDAGRRAGNASGAFGMGNLRLSYVMNMLRDWCGDAGEVRTIELEYRLLNHKGDTLTAVGVVTSVTELEAELHASVDLDVVNQRGERTASGRATVIFAASPEGPHGADPEPPVIYL